MAGSSELTFSNFLAVVSRHHLWEDGDRLLVGISGGPDSVALGHLAFRTGQLAGLVHVNYGLRGDESDLDEEFVRKLGHQWQVPVYIKHSSREEVTSQTGISLQMAAREIRYTWWETLLLEGRGNRLLTGHHADDQIETVLLHWLRGTGMTGWTGIPFRRGAICRPLLPFSRDHVMHYLEKHDLTFRQDKSNDTDKYLRNRLRHHVVPELKAIQPGIAHIVQQQSEDARMALEAADHAVDYLADGILTKDGNHLMIRLSGLNHVSWASYALYRWLHPKGFNRSQIQTLLGFADDAHGQIFQTASWEGVVDRGVLICRPKPDLSRSIIHEEIWRMESTISCAPGTLRMEPTSLFTPSDLSDRNRIILDVDQLHFPLTLRSWQPGDRMQPHGLAGTKKIKKLLIDDKTSPFEKQEKLVLVHGQNQEILWLIGHRSSQRGHPGQDAKNLVILEWIPASE